MKLHAKTLLSVGLVLLLPSTQVWAAFNEFAVAGKASTLGVGGELVTNIMPQVNLRAGVHWLSLHLDKEFQSTEYALDLEFLNPLVVADWYVFKGSFRLSGGVLFNGTSVDLRARPKENMTIGDNTYEPEEVGTLKGDLDFAPIAPYVGIGWGNALGRSKRWGFTADLGVAFIGSPDVSLSSTGTVAPADLSKEERKIENDISDFKFYPVLSLSLFYCF